MTSGGIGGNHEHGAPLLARGPSRSRAGVHGLRRSAARRWTAAAGSGERRRAPHQSRSDVALHRGTPQLESDLAGPRHSHPAGAEQPLARSDRAAASVSRTFPAPTRLGTLQHITTHGYPYTWFLLNRAIIKKEFALSGSEQNPDLTGKSIRLHAEAHRESVQAPVQAFMDKGADFVVRNTLRELVAGMNALIGDDQRRLRRRSSAKCAIAIRRSRNVAGKDPQLAIVRNARTILSERLVRVAKPAPILDPADGPLIAVKLNILTRKSLGGLETDLDGRVLRADGQPMPGLYAAGEVAGFGGGGVHGYRALEGTFLGGCIFSGRVAGRAAAAAARN